MYYIVYIVIYLVAECSVDLYRYIFKYIGDIRIKNVDVSSLKYVKNIFTENLRVSDVWLTHSVLVDI